ncbi:MAG: DNA-binding protein [Deltaproteobacteria bacterium]|nr:DNA-binding protein [Deltaproteobacteria bacterium]
MINLQRALLTGVLVFAAQVAIGQPMGGGPRAGGRYMHLFDPKTVGEFKGEIVKVEKVSMMDGMTGMHAVFRTAGGEFSLHLGPDWFIENQETKLAPGDHIEVTGSKANTRMGPAIIALEVRRGDDVMKLRDAAGTPYWVAWRRR